MPLPFSFKLLPAPTGGFTMTGTCDIGQTVKVEAHLQGAAKVPGRTLVTHQQVCGTNTTPLPNYSTNAIYFNHPGTHKFVFSSNPPPPQTKQLQAGVWVFEAQETSTGGVVTKFPMFTTKVP
jgi:hypothetical protein